MKTKDNYLGFNSYLNDDDNNSEYFRLIYNKIKHYLVDLDKIKGSSYSKYNDKYSIIYMKYHFIGFFYEIINCINDLKDSQSEITSDANDLFQSLEMRDDDLIDDIESNKNTSSEEDSVEEIPAEENQTLRHQVYGLHYAF